MSRRLAAIFAHPDDDGFGVSGTAALHADEEDFELTVILATSGEAGEIADPSLATRESLGRVREAEDRAAWATLGVVPNHHHALRYPDGGLAEVPRHELARRVAELLLEARPDVVVTFGPEGITGHTDHIAIGDAATEAFHLARRGSPETGFRRLLYSALAEARLAWFGQQLRERGMEPPDPTQPFQPRGVPDESIAVVVDCASVWKRKHRSLLEHRTQGELEGFPEDLLPAILGVESFTQGWPERSPGEPVLSDVFEGLPGA